MQKSVFFTVLLILAAILTTSVFWEWRSRRVRPAPIPPAAVEAPVQAQPEKPPEPPPLDVLSPLVEAASQPSAQADRERFRTEQERLARRQLDVAKQADSEALRLTAQAEQAQARYREAADLSDRIQLLALENTLLDQRLASMRSTFSTRLSGIPTAVVVLTCRDKDQKGPESELPDFARQNLAGALAPPLVLADPGLSGLSVVVDIVAGVRPGRVESAPAPPIAAVSRDGRLCMLQAFYVFPKITPRFRAENDEENAAAPLAATGFACSIVAGPGPENLGSGFQAAETAARVRSLFAEADKQNQLAAFRVRDIESEYAAATRQVVSRKEQVLDQMAGLRAALETTYPEGLARIEAARGAAEDALNGFGEKRRGLYVENLWGICPDPAKEPEVIRSLAEKALKNAVARAGKDLAGAVFLAEDHRLKAADAKSFYEKTYAAGFEPPVVYCDPVAKTGDSGFCGLLTGIWVVSSSSTAAAVPYTEATASPESASDREPPTGRIEGLKG
ncbi:MAG: hypothetical protein AB1921_13225, partial [Thermodesulfobacteriota bacterium]